jgi:hypothetical protein
MFVFQSFRRSANSRPSHRSVRLVVEELESRNLLSAGSAIAPALFDVPAVAGQASIPEAETVVAPVPAAIGSAPAIASLETTDWQRMVESSWCSSAGHSISSDLARTVHYAKVDVMDAGMLDTESGIDDGGRLLGEDGSTFELPGDAGGGAAW